MLVDRESVCECRQNGPWPGLSRPSTSLPLREKDVDHRDKPGDDDCVCGGRQLNRRVGKAAGRERVRWRAHRLAGASRQDGGHGADAPLPTLVIAESIIVRVFREEWPAAGCIPRQAAGDRIEPTLSRFWLPSSVIASALHRTRMVAGTTLVRFTRQGRRR